MQSLLFDGLLDGFPRPERRLCRISSMDGWGVFVVLRQHIVNQYREYR